MKPIGVGISGFLVGGLLTWLVNGSLPAIESGSNPLAPAPATSSSAELASLSRTVGALDESLAVIRDSVEALDGRLAGLESAVVSLPDRRVPVDTGQPERAALLEAVAELRLLVDSRFEEARASIEEVGRGLRRYKTETDWAAMDAFVETWGENEGAAVQELRRLSDEMVLARFGPPSDVWQRESGMTWVYTKGEDPVTDLYDLRIYLNLKAGYVAGVHVERP